MQSNNSPILLILSFIIVIGLVMSGLIGSPFSSSGTQFVLSGSKTPIEGVQDGTFQAAASEDRDTMQVGYIPFATVIPTPTEVPVPTFAVPTVAQTPTPTIPFYITNPTPTPISGLPPECPAPASFSDINPGCLCSGGPMVCWEDASTSTGSDCTYISDRLFSEIPSWLPQAFTQFQCVP